MSKDTFKRTAPTIQFFKDGETIRAKKLGKMIDKIQEGMALLESTVGDIHNRSITFDIPLFQNSLGRAIGSTNQLTVSPKREFAIIQKTKQSLHQGLIRWPHSSDTASVAGNLSMNLLPIVGQLDKTGIGCTRDDGERCIAGYQTFYDKEKNLIQDASLLQSMVLSGWVQGVGGGTTYDVTLRSGSNGGAQMDISYKYNTLQYSENFEFWTLTGPVLIIHRIPVEDPNGQSATYSIEPTAGVNQPIVIGLSGTGSDSSANWCFSIWAAASGERDIHLTMAGSAPTDKALLKGSLEGGIFYNLNLAGETSNWVIPISGIAWKRYWIHTNYSSPVAASTIAAQVVLNFSGLSAATPLYIFGAQLEPTNFPTTYRRTQGAITSGLGSEVSLAYNLNTIPGHTYQLTLAGSGSIKARIDGQNLFTLSISKTSETFLATSDSTYIDAYISGATISTNYLTKFRVDPGTPCHAMNCPGFSAYDKIRNYRAVLPPITESGNQNFTQRLELPDEFQEALYNELPGNILGIFDHELNHAVPDRIVDWKLANWPIGGLELGGQLIDPEFLTDWTTALGNTYPSELTVTVGSGVITRDVAVTSIISTFTLPEGPCPYMAITSGDQFARMPAVDGLFAKSVPATVEFLFRMHSGMSSGVTVAIHGGSTATLNLRTFLIGTTSGKIYANQESTVFGLSITTPLSSTDLRDNAWHHYALIIGNQPRILWQYVDGVFQGASSAGTFVEMDNFVAGMPALGGDLRIGAYYHTVNGYSYPTASGLDIGGFMIRGEFVYSGDPMSSLSFTPPKQSLFNSGTRPKSAPYQLSGVYIHWPMQEGSGQYANDVGTSGHHLEFGTSTLNPSQDPVWVLSGSQVYTEFSSSDTNQIWAVRPVGSGDYAWNQTMTVEGWFKIGSTATLGTATGFVVGRTYDSTQAFNYTNWKIGINNGKYYANVRTQGSGSIAATVTAGYSTFGDEDIINTVTSDDGLWHHVAATFTKDFATRHPIKLFVDGVAVASGKKQASVHFDWDWRILQGEQNVLDLSVPSGMTMLIGGQTLADNGFAFDELIVSSGIKYSGTFTPTTPLVSGSINTTLAKLRANEGMNTSLYNTGPTYQPPLQLRNLTSVANLDDITQEDWRWNSTNSFALLTPSGTPIDRFTIVVSGTGQKGTSYQYLLDVGKIYTWEYRVRADQNYSGIFESYVTEFGAAEVDLLLDANWQNANGVYNKYQVSVTEPGNTNWSEESLGQFWNIKRRLKASSDGTIVTLTVGVSGTGISGAATFDSIDVTANISNSTMFKYQADPVLGLNWEGSAEHVTEENLIPWSSDIQLLNYNNLATTRFEYNILDPSGNLDATKVIGTFIAHQWENADMDIFLDTIQTIQLWARSNNPGVMQIGIYPDIGNDTITDFNVTSGWKEFSVAFSGWNIQSSTNLYTEITFTNQIDIAWLSLHHGSGIVPYVPTHGQPELRFRRVVRVKQPNQLNSNWTQAYGLIGGLPIRTYLADDSVNGLLFETDITVDDFINFPNSGVMRINGQEISYRGKYDDGRLFDCVPAWRGTSVDISNLTSGSVVTYVPLPRAVDRIEDDLVWFKEVLPVADGDWNNQFQMQLYNTQVSNLDRFSLTATAIPLTRAAGSLMTAFMDHVADDARHFRRDQLCAALVDPANYAGFDDMEVRLNLVKTSVQELNQPAILEIFAFGFMNPNNKQIIISWGDGAIETITGIGQYFLPISHTYDLGPSTLPIQHTIRVDVTDLDLGVVRSNFINILVNPESKFSQTVRAVIILQPELIQQSRTAIWAVTSGIQTARTNILNR